MRNKMQNALFIQNMKSCWWLSPYFGHAFSSIPPACLPACLPAFSISSSLAGERRPLSFTAYHFQPSLSLSSHFSSSSSFSQELNRGVASHLRRKKEREGEREGGREEESSRGHLPLLLLLARPGRRWCLAVVWMDDDDGRCRRRGRREGGGTKEGGRQGTEKMIKASSSSSSPVGWPLSLSLSPSVSVKGGKGKTKVSARGEGENVGLLLLLLLAIILFKYSALPYSQPTKIFFSSYIFSLRDCANISGSLRREFHSTSRREMFTLGNILQKITTILILSTAHTTVSIDQFLPAETSQNNEKKIHWGMGRHAGR